MGFKGKHAMQVPYAVEKPESSTSDHTLDNRLLANVSEITYAELTRSEIDEPSQYGNLPENPNSMA